MNKGLQIGAHLIISWIRLRFNLENECRATLSTRVRMKYSRSSACTYSFREARAPARKPWMCRTVPPALSCLV